MTLAMTGLERKVALITGAGRMRSIGRGIAQSLAQAGCDVVVTGSGRDPQGIRVNAICPGIVMTSRLDDMSQEQWAGVIDAYIPLKRAGEPADIGNMVAFLCSEQGSWVNGQLYSVDGGHAAGR